MPDAPFPVAPLLVAFNAIGNPKAKGSHRAFFNPAGRPVVVDIAGAPLKDWATVVATAASEERQRIGRRLAGPLRIDVVLRLPMPKSRAARVRAKGRAYHWRRPDLDKLLRALFDALTTSGLIGDDGQFAEVHVSKWEVADWCGAEVELWELDG